METRTIYISITFLLSDSAVSKAFLAIVLLWLGIRMHMMQIYYRYGSQAV